MIVTRKLLIPTLIFIAVVFLGFITINTLNKVADIEASEEQNLEDKLEIFQERLESRESFAVGLALEVANNPEVQAAFAAGDRDRLTELTLPAYLLIDEQFDVPQHQFHLPPATSFLRLHSLDKFDDDLSSFRFTVLTANAEQRPVSGLEIGRGGLGIRGIAPVSYENEHIGTVEFGLNVDQTLLNTLEDQMNADLQLMLLRGPAEEVATFAGATADVQGPTDDLILQASTFEEPIFGDATIYPGVLQGTPAISRISVDDLQYAIISAPVLDFSGQVIGVVEIFTDRTAVIANETQNVVTAVIAALITISFGGVGLAIIITRMLRPIGTLTETAVAIAEGDLNRAVAVKTKDEIGTLATSFNNMTAQLRDLVGSLEQRVAQRTQIIETSAEVSRRLSTILDPSELTTAVVDLLQVAFKYYHAHIYLYDEKREYLVMVGGTGEAGHVMLANNHKIEHGKGLVGRTAINNTPTLVPDVSADIGWLPNPLLPDTKAEVAVPITLDNEVLGVLDIQHNVTGGLNQEDVTLLTSIASQVAIGLQNARQYQQLQESEAGTKAILDTINIPLLITRADDGTFLYFNDPALEAVGTSHDNLTSRKVAIFYGDESPGRQQFMAMLRETGKVDNLEITLKRVTGEPFHVVMSARIINYQGERAVMTSFIDISEQHKAREASIRHAQDMETVAELGTVSATILDPDLLLQELVNLIKSRFELYHAHIHLLNDSKDTMVLTAGAGEIGQKMVVEGRSIPLAAEGSLVATVARTRQGAIRNYESAGEGFMPHPLLAETRSEMAVPMFIGNEVLGVLDVRSDQLNYFTEDYLQTFTIMAGQIAVALQNARSYARSEEALQELQELSRRLTREGWSEFFEQQYDELAYRYDLKQVSPVADSDENIESDTETALAQLLQVQGESIGELVLGNPKDRKDEAAEIVAAIAERLSAHIENLRLTEQTRSALANTEALFAGSASVVRASSMPEILEAIVLATSLQRLDLASLNLFEKPWHQNPETITIIAHWEKQPDTPKLPTGTVLQVSDFPTLDLAVKTDFFYVEDVENDPRLDENTVKAYRGIGIKTFFTIPLVVGDQIIGYIGANSHQPILFNDAEIRRISSLVGQAAVVAESLRLFEDARDRAQQEQMLREVTTRIHAAPDTESILRTAAEEIGRALGLEGYVSLEGVGGNGTNGREPVANSTD